MAVDLVRTGIRGFDGILDGGLPRGNLVLIDGAIGTGKTTLGVEFVYRGAHEFDEPGIIVLFDISEEKLLRDAEGFGWDLHELERDGRLRILFTTRAVFCQELQHPDSLIFDQVDAIGARRLFVDGIPGPSVTSLDPRESFQMLAEGLQRDNLTAMLACEQAADGEPSQHEESIADTVIQLRTEDVHRATVRSVQIVKSRGHGFQMGRHTFHIVEGRGIEVYRRAQAPGGSTNNPGSDPPEGSERITTGVPGLDAIANGGWLPDSATLVSGSAGSGKSIVGLQYLAEGAARNERGVLFSLEEPVARVLRNAATIGIDMETHAANGIVRLEFDPRQELEPDHYFARVRQVMDEFEPRRVVFDSLSTCESIFGPDRTAFIDFFHALLVLVRERHATAVYNYQHAEFLGASSFTGELGMNSLVDNIVLMNYIETRDSLRVGLTIAKMRGNPVDRITHECEFVDGGGLRMLARELHAVHPRRALHEHFGLLSRAPERRPSS